MHYPNSGYHPQNEKKSRETNSDKNNVKAVQNIRPESLIPIPVPPLPEGTVPGQMPGGFPLTPAPAPPEIQMPAPAPMPGTTPAPMPSHIPPSQIPSVRAPEIAPSPGGTPPGQVPIGYPFKPSPETMPGSPAAPDHTHTDPTPAPVPVPAPAPAPSQMTQPIPSRFLFPTPGRPPAPPTMPGPAPAPMPGPAPAPMPGPVPSHMPGPAPTPATMPGPVPAPMPGPAPAGQNQTPPVNQPAETRMSTFLGSGMALNLAEMPLLVEPVPADMQIEPGFSSLLPMVSPPPPNFAVPSNPLLPSEYKEIITYDNLQYMNSFLRTQIGKLCAVEFLVGTTGLATRIGFLIGVGINYILIQDSCSGEILVCDFYSVRFVRFFGNVCAPVLQIPVRGL